MTPFTISFPDGYEDRLELEAPSKGYLRNVTVNLEGRDSYQLFFIDPARLEQNLEAEVECGRAYYSEPGMIVVPKVTTDSIRRAVEEMVRDGFFEHLKPFRSEPEA